VITSTKWKAEKKRALSPKLAPKSKKQKIIHDEDNSSSLSPASDSDSNSNTPEIIDVDSEAPKKKAKKSTAPEVTKEYHNELSKLSVKHQGMYLIYSLNASKMMHSWRSIPYSFYAPIPDIEYVFDRVKQKWHKIHTFHCTCKDCKYCCHHYLDSPTDCTSMGNLTKHAKNCWDKAYTVAQWAKIIGNVWKNILEPVMHVHRDQQFQTRLMVHEHGD